MIAFVSVTDADTKKVDKSIKGLIDLRWKTIRQNLVEFTIEFRKKPDEEPYFKKTFTAAVDTVTAFTESASSVVLTQMIGVVRPRPFVILGDF